MGVEQTMGVRWRFASPGTVHPAATAVLRSVMPTFGRRHTAASPRTANLITTPGKGSTMAKGQS